jgi:hypothetical protein
MNNIESLLKAVDKAINGQSMDISSSKILKLIEHNSIELDTPKFSTLLSNKVVKPTVTKIDKLEEELRGLGSGRTNSKQRRSVLSKITKLKDLLTEVFVSYNHYLKDDCFFLDYKKEKNEKYTKHEDEIIKGSLDEETLESIMYPTYFDVEKIQNLSNVIKEHLKSLNLDKDNYEFAKERTKSFYKKTKDSIYIISKAIDKSNTTLKHAEIKLRTVNENEVYEDVEKSISYNLKEYYHQNVIDLYSNLDNLNKHKNILADLLNDLTKNYSYLADIGSLSASKITVFGDSNFEKVKELANSLITFDFVSMHLSIDDLIQVFTLNEDKPTIKINLINGTLNDFGFLISQMKPFFIDSVSNKANYSLWWSERFTFNSKHKTIKDVSNMISAVNKDISRRPAKMETISQIIDCLGRIPH